MTEFAGLYTGTVMHQRFTAPGYRFSYRLFSVLVDIDRLGAVAAPLRLLSHNRFNLLSLHDRDHGPKDGSALRPWIDGVLGGAGISLEGGRVMLLCTPRMLGFGFNPLSVWYCYHENGQLTAVLCEVRNTFGEWHGYLLHHGGAPLPRTVRSEVAKCFHVSPFFPVRGHYRFRLRAPGQRLGIGIQLHQDGQLQMAAVQQARRSALSDRRLLGILLAYPFNTFKVVAAIHWQALKLWLRGATYHRKPSRPEQEISG